jgi:dienelactone hydrolase
MQKLIITFILTISFTTANCASSDICNPPPENVATLKEIVPKMHTVSGPLAEFNPCDSSVRFHKPKDVEKPPLILVIHGGAGIDVATERVAALFRSKGFATLIFDAFRMNKIRESVEFFSYQVTNDARQRMIYKTALGAYEWAVINDDINNKRIYLYGISNGAVVVANLAAAVSKEHVKGAFAEGMPGSGLGLPDKPAVPLRLIYGKLDNYAGKNIDEWVWVRQEPCYVNTHSFIQPPGNAKKCNLYENNLNLTQKPIDWINLQKQNLNDVDVWFYDDAAHGIFTGAYSSKTVTYGANLRRFAPIGASDAARNKLSSDIDNFISKYE